MTGGDVAITEMPVSKLRLTMTQFTVWGSMTVSTAAT